MFRREIKYYEGLTHLTDGWFLKNHIINYFFLVWLQSSNFYLNKPHVSMVLIAGSDWLLLKATISLMGLSLPLPLSFLMGLRYERHSFSCYKQSQGLFGRPTRVLLSAFRGTIQTMYSAAFQKTNTWIWLISCPWCGYEILIVQTL